MSDEAAIYQIEVYRLDKNPGSGRTEVIDVKLSEEGFDKVRKAIGSALALEGM